MAQRPDRWTSGEIEILRGLAAAGRSPDEIAPRLGRTETSVRAQLAREKAPSATPPEWNGPDEEGDVLPPTGRADDDPAAWVHSEHKGQARAPGRPNED
jgi:predicted transcriptional regulator